MEFNLPDRNADLHTRRMEQEHLSEIEASAAGTRMFDANGPFGNGMPLGKRTASVSLSNTDSVSAVLDSYDDGRTAVLNFANFLRPGGGYGYGGSAQEEALCRESFLYNVIARFPGWYAENSGMRNRSMFAHRLLYSPDVLFMRDGREKLCDVITCAAPDYRTGRALGVTAEENARAMDGRIRLVLRAAAEMGADDLILGAFGCGVFGQDAGSTAALFRKHLEGEFSGAFRRVTFAVYGNDGNYGKFVQAFR